MIKTAHQYGRTRLDIGLIVVCLVVLVGGLGVFRSYADPAPIDLTQEGSSALSKPFTSQSKQQTNSKQLSLKTSQEMEYCFKGSFYGASELGVSVMNNGSTKTYQQSFDGSVTGDEDLLCFEAANSGVIKIQLHAKGIVKVNSITATKTSL